MDRDQQLLATARDCFNFVTKFFEVIKVSAPHIYHSALELSPQSAIVRKLYHHHRPCSLPRVVKGVPSSWDQTLTIKTNHKFSTWSPCGKSLAVATPNNVEIWDILTVGKHSTLQPTNPSHTFQDIPKYPPDWIAYSPDGRSLACYSSSSATIIIWDIQTGGVASEIECGVAGTAPESLVWSSDGQTIGAVFASGWGWAVYVCDVTSGTMVSPGTLRSPHKPYLWPHNKSLRVLITSSYGHRDFDIYEAGPTLLRIELFSIMPPTHGNPQTISFSPATGRISVVTDRPGLLIITGLNPEILLDEVGSFHGHRFSLNGELLAASGTESIQVWQYESNYYHRWKEIPFHNGPRDLPQDIQFSPSSSSSMLIPREGFLKVAHLGITPTPLHNPPPPYSKISTNGAYIVTVTHQSTLTPQHQSTLTITNLSSQTPSSFIQVDTRVDGLALTGNILLAVSGGEVIVWRLSAEGAVEGVPSGLVADQSHKIWSCARSMRGAVESLVIGDTGIIRFYNDRLVCYNTDTGERYRSAQMQAPARSAPWHNLADNHNLHTHLHYHSFCEHNNPPEDNQLISIPSYKEGWVKYPEGEHPHRFWLPPDWMTHRGDSRYWLDDIKTLWLHGSELAVIKF
jgi:hypothetical protein